VRADLLARRQPLAHLRRARQRLDNVAGALLPLVCLADQIRDEEKHGAKPVPAKRRQRVLENIAEAVVKRHENVPLWICAVAGEARERRRGETGRL